MIKVGQEQIEYTVNFKNSLENTAQVNHVEPLNKLLNSQKNYWQSREQKAKERYLALKDDDHSIQQSQINIPNNHETQLIESLIKLRTHTHDFMAQQYKQKLKNRWWQYIWDKYLKILIQTNNAQCVRVQIMTCIQQQNNCFDQNLETMVLGGFKPGFIQQLISIIIFIFHQLLK
ncbi:hypothetical protein pb186bvf_020783 [Paramecium bursaria]